MSHHLVIHNLDNSEAHYEFDNWAHVLDVIQKVNPTKVTGIMVVMGNDDPEPRYYGGAIDGQQNPLTPDGEVALGNDGAKPL